MVKWEGGKVKIFKLHPFDKLRISEIPRGFTLIELIVITGILLTLMTVVTISMLRSQQKASVAASVDILESNLKEQQTKAMIGDTEGRTTASPYGIKFFADRYVLFHGETYDPSDPANFIVILEGTLDLDTTFPNNEIIFSQGSGDVSGYSAGNDTVLLQSTSQNEQKLLQLNKLGVVTSIN